MSQTINVYEKEADLSHVILGVENEPKRAQFNEIVKVLEGKGFTVNRFDPVHTKEAMKEGVSLPSIFIDDTCVFEGDYPSVDDIVEHLNLDRTLFDHINRSTILNEANTTRLGSCCGVGQDIYLDPNEDDLW